MMLPLYAITEPLDEPDQGKKAISHKGTKPQRKAKTRLKVLPID